MRFEGSDTGVDLAGTSQLSNSVHGSFADASGGCMSPTGRNSAQAFAGEVHIQNLKLVRWVIVEWPDGGKLAAVS